MIYKVTIGNLNLKSDNAIVIDNKAIKDIEINQISKDIWWFTYNTENNSGEVEFQGNEKMNKSINSLSDLQNTIGCSLASIKQIFDDNQFIEQPKDE
jgi:hypothetical protein